MRIASLLTIGLTAVSARAAEPFAVTVAGSGSPALIFIPGLACSGDVWKETVDHFKAKHECHVLTLAGFAGQPPADGPFLDGMTAAVAKYAKEKKLVKPVVVGHSLGASLALKIGAEHGDVFGGAVAVDGYPCMAALFLADATDATRLAMGNGERDKFLKQTDAEYAVETTKMFSSWLKGERMATCEKWIKASDRKTVAMSKGELFASDLRPSLKQTATPVLLLLGYNDTMKRFGIEKEAFDGKAKDQIAGVKNATVAVHPNCQHFIMWDEPKWLTDRIDAFLEKK